VHEVVSADSKRRVDKLEVQKYTRSLRRVTVNWDGQKKEQMHGLFSWLGLPADIRPYTNRLKLRLACISTSVCNKIFGADF
jgi:hypothetical protein